MQHPAKTLLAASLLALAAPGCYGDPDTEAALAFDRSVLHRIDITVEDEYLSELETNLDARVPCTFIFDDITVDEAGIRQKGGANSLRDIDVAIEGTNLYKEQPSFSVRLDEFDENGDVHGLRRIILNSSAQDPTFLHPIFGSDLAHKAGLPAARAAHGIVSLNGVPFGLYTVTEAVDNDFLGRAFGTANDQGNLYEGRKVDFTEVASLELKDEESDHRDRDDLQAFADVLLTTPSPELEAAVREKMDLDRFITAFALETAINHFDGFAFNKNNYYLYDNPADDRFVFIPHGMDRIVQPYLKSGKNELEKDTLEDDPEALLPQLILKDPAMRGAFLAELSRIANELWDLPAIFAEIDRIEAVISAAKTTGVRDTNDVALFKANLGDWRDALTKRRDTLVSATTAEGPGGPAE